MSLTVVLSGCDSPLWKVSQAWIPPPQLQVVHDGLFKKYKKKHNCFVDLSQSIKYATKSSRLAIMMLWIGWILNEFRFSYPTYSQLWDKYHIFIAWYFYVLAYLALPNIVIWYVVVTSLFSNQSISILQKGFALQSGVYQNLKLHGSSLQPERDLPLPCLCCFLLCCIKFQVLGVS